MVAFLSGAEHAKLSRYPEDMPDGDLGRFFTLSPQDLALIEQQRSEHNRLGFTLQLTSLRYLGSIPDDLLTPPPDLLALIAQQLGVAQTTLSRYGEREQTRSDHLLHITWDLGFRRVTPLDLLALEDWLVECSLEHDKESYLLCTLLERLRWHAILRPGLSSLERLVATREGGDV